MRDLTLLRTFLATYRSGTVTSAARTLHLSQPAVSLQLQALEAQLGRPLLTRLPRGVEPTPLGHELARAIAPHLDGLEQALDAASPQTGSRLGTLHLGGPEEFLGHRVVPALTGELRKGLELRLRYELDASMFALLAEGELDLAVTTTPPTHRALEHERLCHEQLVLVGAPDLVAGLGSIEAGPAGAAALGEVQLLAFDEDLPLLDEYWRRGFGQRLGRRAAIVSESLHALRMVAELGIGITVLPSHVCDRQLATGALVEVVTPKVPPRSSLYLAWRADALRSAGTRAAHAAILAAARDWD
jgi:DNA-binding transcriptional LysR family regulator